MELQLENEVWTLNETNSLGKGGFGKVFEGNGDCGPVAIKRLNESTSDRNVRELSIAAGLAVHTARFIVPILDYGVDLDTERAYLVMPICEGNLSDYVEENGPLDDAEIANVGLQILSGLEEAGDYVHRDLKPDNILKHDGQWKLADFGIAKHVQDSTSLNTLKRCLSPHYGAPEQWLDERISSATDVYALGCILYYLAIGKPPFVGDSQQVREGHIIGTLPEMNDLSPDLRALVSNMTRKAQTTRPNRLRIKACLEKVLEGSPASRPKNLLAQANAEVAKQNAAAEARLAGERRERNRLTELQKEARQSDSELWKGFEKYMKEYSSETIFCKGAISLGHGNINDNSLEPCNVKQEDLHIVAYRKVAVTQERQAEIYALKHEPLGGRVINRGKQPYKHSSTLFFGKTEDETEYRWWEVGFFSILEGTETFALDPKSRDFQNCFTKTVQPTCISFGPIAVDAEDSECFYDRLASMLARAAVGKLNSPDEQPLNMDWFG